MGILQDSLEVVKLAAKFANPELIERVTALNEQVLELSTKNIEFQQEVFRLQTELQEADRKLVLIGEVEREMDFVYRKGEPEPCCPRCYDVDRRLVHIVETREPKIGITPSCPQCDTIFGVYPKGLRGRS